MNVVTSSNDGPRLHVQYHDDLAVIRLLGEHDMATQPDLLAVSDQALAAADRMIVDLSETQFVDSKIINALCDIHRTATLTGRRVALQLPPPGAGPRRALEICELHRLIPSGETREAAIEATRATVSRTGPGA